MRNGTRPGKSCLRAYWRSLKKAPLEKPIEFLALIIATVAAGFVWWQIRSATDALESQAYSYIVNGLAELDKMNLEHPELRHYFNRNDVELPKAEVERAKILSLADAQLDFIDAFYTQHDKINWSKHTQEGWENYFAHSFECSPVLRDRFCAEYNEYGHSIHKFAEERLPGLCEGRAAAKPPPMWTWPPKECHE
jgi:hypothetical protein